jgi:hypothetical protein
MSKSKSKKPESTHQWMEGVSLPEYEVRRLLEKLKEKA